MVGIFTFTSLGLAQTPAPPAPQEVKYLAQEYWGLKWQGFQQGLSRSRAELLAALVVVDSAEGNVWEELQEHASPRSVQKRLKGFVRIAVTADEAKRGDPEDDPKATGDSGSLTVRRLLGALEGKSVVALLDLHGTILKRWDEIPSKREFKAGLTAVLKHNHRLAQRERKCAELVSKGGYALEIKKYRESVQLLLEAEKIELGKHSRAAERATELRKKLDEIIAKGEKEAQDFVSNDKLGQAVDRYERLLRDFPFPLKMRSWRKEITELWRRIRSPYPGNP